MYDFSLARNSDQISLQLTPVYHIAVTHYVRNLGRFSTELFWAIQLLYCCYLKTTQLMIVKAIQAHRPELHLWDKSLICLTFVPLILL